MEEDTELRDLVVQTLENNGVLAKVRVRIYESFGFKVKCGVENFVWCKEFVHLYKVRS